MKFIYVIRNPYDRTVSQYMHMYERGYINSEFDESIRKIPSLINNSRYYTQIIPFIRKFGKEKILFVHFSDLIKTPQSVFDNVCSFLQIDSFKINDIVHENITLGGGKWNFKYDKLKSNLNRFRGFLPRNLRNALWDIVTGRKKRAFKVKPKLEHSQKQVIKNLLELDMLALQKLTGYKYTKWLD